MILLGEIGGIPDRETLETIGVWANAGAGVVSVLGLSWAGSLIAKLSKDAPPHSHTTIRYFMLTSAVLALLCFLSAVYVGQNNSRRTAQARSEVAKTTQELLAVTNKLSTLAATNQLVTVALQKGAGELAELKKSQAELMATLSKKDTQLASLQKEAQSAASQIAALSNKAATTAEVEKNWMVRLAAKEQLNKELASQLKDVQVEIGKMAKSPSANAELKKLNEGLLERFNNKRF